MTTTVQQALAQRIEDLIEDLEPRKIYGWGDHVGLALADAVFSIRAQYEAKSEGKGVLGRLNTLKAEHETSLLTLTGTAAISEDELSRIMGYGKTAERSKSGAVVEAAQKLSQASLNTRDAIAAEPQTARKIYTSVKGLGPVTAEYFLMLLGVPGVKADVQITAFVNETLESAGLPPVDTKTAGELIKAVHASHYQDHPALSDIRLFDNAIWRYQSTK